MDLRPATREDIHGILAIYNDVIATSTAVYTEAPATLADRQEWFAQRERAGYPVIVATDASGVTAFGSFGDFRAWPCYCHTVEHSVHVRADRRGAGLGSRIVSELIERAAAMGKHVMVAGIDAANGPSLRMHEKLGFERVAHFREVGRKFDRWLDLVFMQRML